MDLTKRIDAILSARNWGWADLARLMDVSPQRVNNWRLRGVPANKLRAIEAALGLKRYALEEEQSEDDEAMAAAAQFAWVYKNVSPEGRSVLIDTIAFVKRSFITTKK